MYVYIYIYTRVCLCASAHREESWNRSKVATIVSGSDPTVLLQELSQILSQRLSQLAYNCDRDPQQKKTKSGDLVVCECCHYRRVETIVLCERCHYRTVDTIAFCERCHYRRVETFVKRERWHEPRAETIVKRERGRHDSTISTSRSESFQVQAARQTFI